METIDFNTVIAENISVVEGLLPEASSNSKGLMRSTTYQRAIISDKITFSDSNTDDDLKNITENGVYFIGGVTIGSIKFYGNLIHLASGTYIFQMFLRTDTSKPSMYLRYKSIGGWTDLVKIGPL